MRIFEVSEQNHLKRLFLLTLFYGLILGIIGGSVRTVIFINQDNYLSYNLSRAIYYHFRYLVNHYLIIATVVCAVLALSTHFIKRLRDFILPVFISSGLFLAGGYYLNKEVFPGFYEIKSLIGNSVFGISCLLTGFFIYRNFRPTFNFIKKSLDER